MERFLVYSLEHERPIRILWQEEDGSFRQANARVTAWDGRMATIVTARPKRTITLPAERILSADFRKGDEGEG